MNRILLLALLGVFITAASWTVAHILIEGTNDQSTDNREIVAQKTFYSPAEEYSGQNGIIIANLTLNGILVITSCTDVVISNVTAYHESIAICIVNSTNVTVSYCHAANGIRAVNSVNVTIDNCSVVDSVEHYASISAEDSSNITVNSCSIASGYIAMENTSGITISSNIFTWSIAVNSNYNEIWTDYCTGIIVVSNTLVPGYGGIDIMDSENVTVKDNTVDARGAYESIRFLYSRDVLASGNRLGNCTDGINIEDSSSLVLVNNTVTHSSTGTGVYIGYDCLIENNSFNVSHVGILTLNISDFTARDNTICNAGIGIDSMNSSLLSSTIHITGNHFWNVTNVTQIHGFDDFTEEGLFMHDNYCNGVLFNGTEAQCVVTTATATTSSAFLSLSLPALAVLFLIRLKKGKKRR